MSRIRRLRFSPLGISPTALPSSLTRSARSARLALRAADRGGSISTPAHGTRGGAALRLRQSTHICIQRHPSKSPNPHQLQNSNTHVHSSPSPRPSNGGPDQSSVFRRPSRLSDTRPGPFRHAGSQHRADRRNQSSGGGNVAASQRRHDRLRSRPRVGRRGRGSAVSKCFAAPPSPAEPADFSSSRCVSSLVPVSLGLGPSLVLLGPSRRFTRLAFFWSGSGLAGLSRTSESPDVPAAATAAARLASSCAGPSRPPSAFCVHAGDVASGSFRRQGKKREKGD